MSQKNIPESNEKGKEKGKPLSPSPGTQNTNTNTNNNSNSNSNKNNDNHHGGNDCFSHPFLDFNQLNEQMSAKGIASEYKLQYIYDAMQGEYHDEAHSIIKKPVSAIVALGSFPVEIGYIESSEGVGQNFAHNQSFVTHQTKTLKMLGHSVSINDIKSYLARTIGASAFMSYLNPKNASLETLAQKTLSLEHYSVLHTVQVSVLVCGLSCGVEHELSSQRDIVHLSRLTVAKTQAQQTPLLVLPESKAQYYPLYAQVKQSIEDMIALARDKKNHNNTNTNTNTDSNVNENVNASTRTNKRPIARNRNPIPIHSSSTVANTGQPDENKTDWEALNLLFPAAKASAILITGSLKNMMKLIALKDAGGKEDELIDVLLNMEHTLSQVFPEFFKKDN
jgi:hypothetical protein